MGLIEKIFGKRRPQAKEMAHLETFSAYSPVFTSWGGQLYESALVREAIYAKGRHIMKLRFDMRGSAKRELYNAVKIRPNPFSTWPDFLERCNAIYETQNNLIIVPVLDEYGMQKGFWPVFPAGCEIRENAGTVYLIYQLQDGRRQAMELDRCVIIRKHQLKNDFFGENNACLTPTMELITTFEQSIQESVKSAASYRFMAQVTNYMFDEDLKKERKRFDKLNFESGEGGGLLLFNANVKDIKQLEAAKNLVDKDQQELIEKNVWRYFGVSEDVIMNTATPEKLSTFYDGEIEPFAIKMSDGMSSMIYTDREQAAGNRALLAANRLQYMSVPDKVSMSQQLGDRGALLIDEIRDLFNYPPLPDGAGQHAPIRGEYYMVDQGRPDSEKQEEKKDAE
jgi:hypothetical protein